MLRATVVLAVALGFCSLVALGQPAQPDKKADAAKSKEPAKTKTPLDQAKLPKNAIVIVVDSVLDAWSMFPKAAVLPFEKYQEMLAEIESLKKQLKADKKRPSSCVLHGKLEGDYLAVRAEYAFSTEQPKTKVLLGLLGGHLTDEGELDGAAPNLEFSEEGFTVRVEKEGNHRLTLNLRVPVQLKKATLGPGEHGLELGLPGAAATIVHLELHPNIKELRWNDTLEKTKNPGRWQINGLEKSKTLSLTWKEPVSVSGNTPLTKVEGQISVRIDEKFVTTSADLSLEDSRAQTKEWRLLLPAQAKVEVKAPGGLTYELLPPDGKTAFHTLRASDATAERWHVSVFVTAPRPNPNVRLPIGPFFVVGAFQQQGTINVQMPTEVSFGQRLVFARSADVFPLKNTEAETVFQYLTPATLDKNGKPLPAGKASLELEWRLEKNQLETQVEHALKLKTVNDGWEIDATTKIQVKALFAAVNSLDIKLPLPRPRGVSLVGTANPGTPFPASIPWTGVWKTFGMTWPSASPDDYIVQDDTGNPLKLVPLDATGKSRVFWDRSPAKQMTLVLKSSFRVPGQSRRLRIELPRPINTQDHGAKLAVQTDDRIELLHGPAGAAEPVPDRHHFDLSWDLAPTTVDVAWRPFHREIVARSTIDVTLHEHTAQVQQTLRFPLDRSTGNLESKTGHVQLLVPREIGNVTVVSGGQILDPTPIKQSLWLRPTGDAAGEVEVVLQYDLPLAKKLHVTPIWPAHVSQKDVKVRIWSPAGVKVKLTDDLLERSVWKERSVEAVPDRTQFPTLVVQGYGTQVPLTLAIEEAVPVPLAAFLAERALMQVEIGEDGSQHYQARYFLRKIQTPHVDVELPLPIARLRDRSISIGKHTIDQVDSIGPSGKVLRVMLHPDLVDVPAVLEIRYTIPSDALERTSAWKATLYPPMFLSDVVIAQMRWQVSLPTPAIAASLGQQVRAETQWTLQGGLLTPEPSRSGADLDAWLTGQDPMPNTAPVSFAFAHLSQQPETIYFFPRWGWWLGCSGVFLVVTLGTYFSPLPRIGFAIVLLLLGLGLLVMSIAIPAALAPVLFGLQPGVVLFLVFVGAHWCVEERDRRQLIFMTGFTRAKPNSTLVRSNSAVKKPREASTVDAPGAAPDQAASSSQAGS